MKFQGILLRSHYRSKEMTLIEKISRGKWNGMAFSEKGVTELRNIPTAGNPWPCQLGMGRVQLDEI